MSFVLELSFLHDVNHRAKAIISKKEPSLIISNTGVWN